MADQSQPPADEGAPGPIRPGVRLGVDVGAARVGVAASDPGALLATPVTTLTRDEEGGSDLDSLAEMVSERAAIEVIVGLPRGLDGAEGAAASSARSYAKELARKIAPVSVRLVDERLSTVDAHRVLLEAGRSRRHHREVVDQAAAVVILQTALDNEKATGRPPGQAVSDGTRRRAKERKR